jgi:glucose/arabinose dehydrogenase
MRSLLRWRSVALVALIGGACSRADGEARAPQAGPAPAASAAAQAAAPAAPAAPAEDPSLPLQNIKLPPGFRIALYARVPKARSLALGPKGTVFVGQRERDGMVHAVRDRDGDGRAEEVTVVARGLDTPNGVAVRGGALYVAEISRILRYDGIEDRLANPPAPAVVTAALPTERHHGWKFIAFGPDDRLYVPVGAPCNICLRDDPRFASITRMKADGTGFEVYAHGVRNTVGFDWHPETGELWFTENGRDLMGDDVPPDELGHAPKAGLHFGYPHCHGGTIADPEFARGRACAEFTAPARNLGPHVAALGMRFYRGRMFPAEYRHDIFMAEHGSWNRSRKVGYRLMRVQLGGAAGPTYETFAEGWLVGETEWGRPVDVLELPDGSLLVSDDEAGAVYRITYESNRQ